MSGLGKSTPPGNKSASNNILYVSIKAIDFLRESLALLKILSISNKSMEEGKGIPAEIVVARLRERIREEERRG